MYIKYSIVTHWKWKNHNKYIYKCFSYTAKVFEKHDTIYLKWKLRSLKIIVYIFWLTNFKIVFSLTIKYVQSNYKTRKNVFNITKKWQNNMLIYAL